MADLQKFIRQHFLANNWSKRCDLSKFSVTRLQEIAETFSNLDIKSKSAVIFTFANSSTPLNKEVSEIVEKVINMALTDENSYIRSAATVLQCRSPLNCLCLDLSETNHSFLTTLGNLLNSNAGKTVSSKILPMSEYLGEKITDEALGVSRSSSEMIGIKGCCLNSSIGFMINDKTPSQRMKEAYLEKLQEECERRRVHVPIPGRSFGKIESNEDASNGIQNRRAPSFPRRTSVVRKTDLLDGELSMVMSTTAGSSARARLLAMHNKNPPPPPDSKSTCRSGRDANEANASSPRRSSLVGAATTTSLTNANRECATSASPTPGAAKRCSKIKILDFSDLPATGIEAKRIKREQQEKAREERRKQKEQEQEERRHAREEARRARTLAAQANNSLKKSSLSTAHQQQQQQQHQAAALISQPQHLQPIAQSQPQQPIPVQSPHLQTMSWGDLQQQQQQQQQWMPFSVAQSTRDGNASIQQSSRGTRDQEGLSGAEEDEEEDDDLEEDGSNATSAGRTFALTAPRGFRGFAEILPSNAMTIRPQQGATILLQRTTPGAVGGGSQLISQFIGQRPTATSLLSQPQPRIKFVRPWMSNSQATAQEGYNGEVVTAASGQRFVQLPDGLITLATTATAAAASQQQQQHSQQSSHQQQTQQQTVIIANSTAHIQTAPAATSQPVFFRAPNLTSVSKTPQQQATTLVVSPSLSQVSVAQTLPVGTSPRPQPRLIQIRPRTPLSTTVPTTAAARPNAIPVILPAGTVVSSQQPQPRIIVANAGLRPVAPAPAAQNQQQHGYTRIVPRPPHTPSGAMAQKQILPQPVLTHPLTREGLNLTPTQVTSIQSLFQGANRLSRLDKATILSFVSGNGVNPQPESGAAQRIRLSEYRERVIDKESGMPMEVAVDTYLLLDYSTGRFESVKSYRTLPPDQLKALPIQPKAPSVVTTSAP